MGRLPVCVRRAMSSGALQKLADASRLDPAHVGVRLDATEIMLDLGEADEARRLIGSLTDDADPRVPQLRARLQFMGEWAKTRRR